MSAEPIDELLPQPALRAAMGLGLVLRDTHGMGTPELGVLMTKHALEITQLLDTRWRLLPARASGTGG
jgi:hypothetical protein